MQAKDLVVAKLLSLLDKVVKRKDFILIYLVFRINIVLEYLKHWSRVETALRTQVFRWLSPADEVSHFGKDISEFANQLFAFGQSMD